MTAYPALLACLAAVLPAAPVHALSTEEEYSVITKEPDYYVRDPIAGFLHKPNAHREYIWAEHPLGRIELKTNNLGFRKDSDTPVRKRPGTVRILITGDSHTDGVVYNRESFASVLEQKLDVSSPTFEVLNGGVGHYGPQNYAGFLRRSLYLKPDVFVVVLYQGNDFLDVLRGREIGPESPDYLKRLEDPALSSAGRELNSVYYFTNRPGDQPRALQYAREEFAEIQALCARRGIRLVAAFLPTRIEVEPGRCAPGLEKDRKILGLSEEDLGLNRRMSGELARWFSSQGIRFVDLSEELKRFPEEQLYWETDYHLAVQGHRHAADALLPLIARPAN